MPDLDLSEVGSTPLIELDLGVAPTVYGKAEWFNLVSADHGGGSVKTRIGKSMLDAAEAAGVLEGSTTVVEASSGNTGAALARVGAVRGYDVTIVAPDDAGVGKVRAIHDAGGETLFVDSERGYDAFVETARGMVDRRTAYYPNQYENPANPAVHAGTTGPEIYRQTDGAVTHFVAGAGTGGTLTGVSHALRDRDVTIHGFEPADADHDIPGLKHIAAPDEYVPGTFEASALDDRELVATDTAHEYARRLRRRHADHEIPIRDPGQWSRREVRTSLRVDGEFLVGPSTGACAAMVARLDRRGAFDDDDVVVIPLPDRGDRYPDRGIWGGLLGD